MKINILDAGISYRGPSLRLRPQDSKHYATAGHDVHVYGLAKMDDETAADFAEWGRLPGCSGKLPMKKPTATTGMRGRLSGTAPRARSSPGTSGRCARRMSGSRPTIRPQEIDACVIRGVSVPMVGCVYWDPGWNRARSRPGCGGACW